MELIWLSDQISKINAQDEKFRANPNTTEGTLHSTTLETQSFYFIVLVASFCSTGLLNNYAIKRRSTLIKTIESK